MSRKPWFTLLEMLIVIVIMGILFAMTLWFGASRVKDLDRQSVSDQFVDGFNSIVWQSRSSSYLDGQKYTSLLIYFASWSNLIDVSLSGVQNIPITPVFKSNILTIKQLFVDQKEIPILTLALMPYSIWCQILSDSMVSSGATIVTDISGQASCYRLDTSLCTLKKILCQ